ncbi:hypothetical protein BS47DRAFT_1481617 [Hydnum rufescens UP504]|uniref:Presequence translocated-associated motor subunit PAM17 n=1 Tax=Hydnum rufescens UP504 TaxID=1448309 RepID=A0A9P6DZY4_9AGAM|nr:hypothetical protein BS47DRAFT_1481617 [Hydnum rufescens UP504]
MFSTQPEQSTSASSSSTPTPPTLAGQSISRFEVGNENGNSYTATVPATLAGLSGGLAYFGSIEADATTLIMGIEPVWIYALATIACSGTGYLIGPFSAFWIGFLRAFLLADLLLNFFGTPAVGSTLWRMTHRKKVALIDAREREFYQHIMRNRVDPSRQSATNPVPDYYGENIGSLKQYRQWLRDQARYRRKAMWPEEL